MSISIVVQIILALVKAFPIIDKWIDEAYNARLEERKKKNTEAIDVAIETQDQRPIEDAMGSTKAGEASGHNGTVIVDSWPDIK